MSEANSSDYSGWSASEIKSHLQRGAASRIAAALGVKSSGVYNVIARRCRSLRIEAAIAREIGESAEEIFGPPSSPYRIPESRSAGRAK